MTGWGSGRVLLSAAATMFLGSARVSAHHAFAAEYDESQVVTVSGIVSRFEWTNPHALLYIDGRDAGGNAGNWKFEMGPPGGLERRGWKKTDLKDGDRITVDGYAAKDGSHVASARTVKLADGRRLFGGSECSPGNPFKHP